MGAHVMDAVYDIQCLLGGRASVLCHTLHDALRACRAQLSDHLRQKLRDLDRAAFHVRQPSLLELQVLRDEVASAITLHHAQPRVPGMTVEEFVSSAEALRDESDSILDYPPAHSEGEVGDDVLPTLPKTFLLADPFESDTEGSQPGLNDVASEDVTDAQRETHIMQRQSADCCRDNFVGHVDGSGRVWYGGVGISRRPRFLDLRRRDHKLWFNWNHFVTMRRAHHDSEWRSQRFVNEHFPL